LGQHLFGLFDVVFQITIVRKNLQDGDVLAQTLWIIRQKCVQTLENLVNHHLWVTPAKVAQNRQHQGIGAVVREQARAVDLAHIDQTIAIMQIRAIVETVSHAQGFGADVDQALA
jgi:hypothetical protein